jgi:hypothetical protein
METRACAGAQDARAGYWTRRRTRERGVSRRATPVYGGSGAPGASTMRVRLRRMRSPLEGLGLSRIWVHRPVYERAAAALGVRGG